MIIESNIKITPAGVFVEEISHDGAKVLKQIGVEDLQQVFENTTIETPLLPYNTIYYNRSGGNKWSVACMIPAQIRAIPIHSRNGESFTVTVPIPNTIFGFGINNGAISKTFCTTTKYNPLPQSDNYFVPASLEAEAERGRTNRSLLDTPCFVFPYGNTWDDFRICWGNIRLPQISAPYETTKLIDLFFNGGFNGDLFHVNTTREFDSFVRHMDGKTSIPSDTLIQHSGNKCLRDFISLLQ